MYILVSDGLLLSCIMQGFIFKILQIILGAHRGVECSETPRVFVW